MSKLKEQEIASDTPRISSRALRSWQWLWSETKNGDHDASPAPATDTADMQTPSVWTRLAPLKVITWLGASTGGLTILLAAVGFLALGAHDAMLGIPRSMQSNSEYVAVGGLFFGRSVIFLVASFVSLQSWIVLGVLLIGVVAPYKIPGHLFRGRSLVIVLFSIALLAAEVYGLARLIRPLQISDLLLNLSASENGPGKQVIEALLVKDTTWLSVEYGFLLLLILAFSISFIFLEQESTGIRTQFWRLVRVPAFILLVICVFLLPRAYGVLTLSNDYPEVSLDTTNQSTNATVTSTRFLLRENDKLFVLFDPTSQSIVTIKRDSITQHRMYAPQHIFTASAHTK